jgi:hypothetical protein
MDRVQTIGVRVFPCLLVLIALALQRYPMNVGLTPGFDF